MYFVFARLYIVMGIKTKSQHTNTGFSQLNDDNDSQLNDDDDNDSQLNDDDDDD